MQSVCCFCNVRIHANSTSALIEEPYHVSFVIQCVLELWCVQFLVPLFSAQLLEWYRVTTVDWERGKYRIAGKFGGEKVWRISLL